MLHFTQWKMITVFNLIQIMVLLSLCCCFNLFILVASSTTIHGAGAIPNADTPRNTPLIESTTVLPWPKTHENSKTSKPKQSSNVRFTSSANNRTRTTVLYSPRAKPTVYSTTCKWELIKRNFQPDQLPSSMERNLWGQTLTAKFVIGFKISLCSMSYKMIFWFP